MLVVVNAAVAAPTLGEQLFDGKVALAAKLAGDAVPLPGYATRCRNCHTNTSPASVDNAVSQSSTPGSLGTGPSRQAVLSRESLTLLKSRRGAPPSRFDEPGFCRLMRQGIDPMNVVMPRLMPRYDLTNSQCHALWIYLTRK